MKRRGVRPSVRLQTRFAAADKRYRRTAAVTARGGRMRAVPRCQRTRRSLNTDLLLYGKTRRCVRITAYGWRRSSHERKLTHVGPG